MYVCRKLRLCNYLLSKGFKYIKSEPMRDKPVWKVWIFESTPELWMEVNNYYSQIIKK